MSVKETLYRIAPLKWRKEKRGELRGFVLRANGANCDFEILSVGYRRELHMDDPGEVPSRPCWSAEFDERNRQGPSECPSIDACKAAAEMCYRELLLVDLVPADA